MDTKGLLLLTLGGLLSAPLYCSCRSLRNHVQKDDSQLPNYPYNDVANDFYEQPSTGSEETSVKFEGEEGLEKDYEVKDSLLKSDVDEETIRKAEEMADQDLLNGLNRILKNNETLTDILIAEDVYEIP